MTFAFALCVLVSMTILELGARLFSYAQVPYAAREGRSSIIFAGLWLLLGCTVILTLALFHLTGFQTNGRWVATNLVVEGVVGVALSIARYRIGFSAPMERFRVIVLGLFYAYLSIIAVDHKLFFASSDNSGVVNWAAFATDTVIDDIQCKASYLLIKDAQAQVAQYRCPISIMFGHPLNEPFVPWPEYTEGSSKHLANALRLMLSK
jgi:hypothetical protein